MTAASSEIHAGVARRTITPPQGIFLIGYGDRSKGNVGVHDDLTATALVVAGLPTPVMGQKQIAIVALDILAINEYVVDRLRQRVGRDTEILLCCSHTHSGPIAYADEKSRRANRDYIDRLVVTIAEVVAEAANHLEPAHLVWSQAEAGIAINRRERKAGWSELAKPTIEIGRNPAGPVDRSVQVVSIMNDAGKRLVTIVNYACHGTVLGPDNLLVSADWIGAMRTKVEAELGGLVMFIQGATGNLNPDMYWNNARAFEMVKEQGEQVADAVITAVHNGSEIIHPTSRCRLGIERSDAWLPFEVPATTSQPPKNYARPLLAMARLPGWLAFLADPLLNQRYPWKPHIEARNGFWAVPMRINAVRIGDLALITFGAEVFTEIGMKARQLSPARHTLFASLTDGCISYLHTTESHSEGGYEVDLAPLAYRYPGRLAAECESLALQTAKALLDKLWSSSD